MRALLVALLLLAAAPAARAQEPAQEAERWLRLFVEQGVGAFLDAILAETALGEAAAARRYIQDNRARWIRDVESYGVPIDLVPAGERHYAPVLKTLCYVVRYRRSPLLFSFRFYRTPRQWELVHDAWHGTDLHSNWECAAAAAVQPARN